LEAELDAVSGMVDDVIFDPAFRPVDTHGARIKGAAFYLLDHPAQNDHLPALRDWFARRNYPEYFEAAKAAGGEE